MGMRTIDAIAEILKLEGIEFLSTFPSTPLIDAAGQTGIRIVVCRQERSQLRNKIECVRRLRKLIEARQHVDPDRVPTRPSRASVARRLAEKSHQSAKKAVRRQMPREDE
jgi:ribosome-associated protein